MEGGEEKLIRDRIAVKAAERGDRMETRRAEEAERIELLRRKLTEESKEFLEADSPDKRVEEAADILEVIAGILKADGHTLADVEATRIAKREDRGGFDEGIVWRKPAAG